MTTEGHTAAWVESIRATAQTLMMTGHQVSNLLANSSGKEILCTLLLLS